LWREEIGRKWPGQWKLEELRKCLLM
jgi:hypothetical protein